MQYGVSAPERLGTTRLSDGRALGWSEWGPVEGKPLLFMSGAGMGRELGFGAHLLQRLGLRLIAVERPGLGVSEPMPSRTLLTFADDIAQLIATHELAKPHILGFSQGAPFALACGVRGLATGLTLVSGQDDFRHPATRAQADAELTGLLDALTGDAAGVERHFANTDAETLLRFVLEGSSDVDLTVYTQPDFLQLYRQSLRSGFSQGGAGYARDFVLAMGSWPFDLGRVEAPVQLWYGRHDQSKVHSPDQGKTLASRLHHAERHLIHDAGGSLLWTHTERLLEAVIGR